MPFKSLMNMQPYHVQGRQYSVCTPSATCPARGGDARTNVHNWERSYQGTVPWPNGRMVLGCASSTGGQRLPQGMGGHTLLSSHISHSQVI